MTMSSYKASHTHIIQVAGSERTACQPRVHALRPNRTTLSEAFLPKEELQDILWVLEKIKYIGLEDVQASMLGYLRGCIVIVDTNGKCFSHPPARRLLSVSYGKHYIRSALPGHHHAVVVRARGFPWAHK